jgi:1-acyl-sn-glycerol-3-phosphate acyltransferase
MYRILVNVIGGVWIDRDKPDHKALKLALGRLAEGRAFGVAPEGTRSRTKALLEGKEGVAYLAAASGAPVVPAAHTGTEKVLWEFLKLRRPRLVIRFGEPFRLPPLERVRRDEQLRQGIDEIMCRIAVMLPVEYRGVYAGHSRVRELAEEGKG